MSDVERAGAGVPFARLRRADDLVGRIEELVSDARTQRQDSITYFLEMALIEARIQLEQGGSVGRTRLRPQIIDGSGA